MEFETLIATNAKQTKLPLKCELELNEEYGRSRHTFIIALKISSFHSE